MAETYTGQVRNGVVVFDDGTPALPEGMSVRVEIKQGELGRVAATPLEESPVDAVAATRTMLLAWAANAELEAPSLPSDLAENHDHYAHGKAVE